MAAGATVGAVHGGFETYAANPNAGIGDYAVGVGLGAAFGAINPYAEFVSAGGAIIGGAIDAYNGGEFFGTGFQVGGLAGGVLGGFGSAARASWRNAGQIGRFARYGVAARAGFRGIAPELAAGGIGASIGYALGGDLKSAYHGATLGMFTGGIGRGIHGLYRFGSNSRLAFRGNWNEFQSAHQGIGAARGSGLLSLSAGYKALDKSLSRFVLWSGAIRFRGAWKGFRGGHLASQRAYAVGEAWRQEAAMVRATGEGTRFWNHSQLDELLSTGRVSGYVGHHIRSVAAYPRWAGDPNNIRFLTPAEHLAAHNGNWAIPTWGDLIERLF